MNGVAVCRKLVAMVVVALSGSGILVATSATPGAAAAGGCAGTAYVTNELDGTVSVITTATGAVSAPITVGKVPVGVAITPDGKRAYVTNYVGRHGVGDHDGDGCGVGPHHRRQGSDRGGDHP